MAKLPKGQLVPNDVIDEWVLRELDTSARLQLRHIAARVPIEIASGVKVHRAVDRSLQRLRKRGKVRIVKGLGQPVWELVE